jgi:hypothetical protein
MALIAKNVEDHCPILFNPGTQNNKDKPSSSIITSFHALGTDNDF